MKELVPRRQDEVLSYPPLGSIPETYDEPGMSSVVWQEPYVDFFVSGFPEIYPSSVVL